jgi:rubredoxin
VEKAKYSKARISMERICPKCRAGRLKKWAELTSDEKFIVERLPMSADFTAEERKEHLFCPNCLFETKPFEETI